MTAAIGSRPRGRREVPPEDALGLVDNYAASDRGTSRWRRILLTIASPIVLAAAIVNLNHPATYVHWGFFQMSVSNLVVIVLMIVVFAAAIAVPFRRRRER